MDSLNPKILIIGAGNMGRAFYNGLSHAVDADHVWVSDRNQEKIDVLAEKARLINRAFIGSTDIIKFVESADWVILAVKPQGFDELMKSLGDRLKNKLIFSIMAGITLDQLQQKTGSDQVIRAMPNLPVSVGEGVIGWVGSSQLDPSHSQKISKLLKTMGQTVACATEDQLNQLTVISGCGPGYFAFFAHIMAARAKSYGFSDQSAEAMVKQTLKGAAAWMSSVTMSSQECADSVACKGGLTEAAISHMKASGLEEIFADAMQKALDRNSELSQ
ncbi:pyrroline-5-carboxylate reductase [Candidatus Peregrinibacteria bacterium]|nr:MAG: pyrroline-5-carboxylate reductase [Candidatus Peregrinibacteria bacterium]